ncbi:MAG: spore cortex-lytic enzyme [Clostridia bacterium]|nr:spore cortex-lytic enzyme [Clostridia bacterium]
MNKRVKILTAIALSFAFICMASAIIYSLRSSATGSAFYAVAEEALTVKQGSRGETVKKIQQKLKNWGYYKGAVDGIFGAQTRKAVILFQKKNGLVADGIVGTKTFKALGISTSGSSGTSSNVKGYSSSDVALLARLIHAEARGESYTGQVAVGAVVLNRVKSSAFPNTISAVIYQPYAFTCVNDGQINLSPNQTALNAAKDAMNGWDPSYGSLYYYNPAVATSKWIFSRKTVVTIGKHVFAM